MSEKLSSSFENLTRLVKQADEADELQRNCIRILKTGPTFHRLQINVADSEGTLQEVTYEVQRRGERVAFNEMEFGGVNSSNAITDEGNVTKFLDWIIEILNEALGLESSKEAGV